MIYKELLHLVSFRIDTFKAKWFTVATLLHQFTSIYNHARSLVCFKVILSLRMHKIEQKSSVIHCCNNNLTVLGIWFDQLWLVVGGENLWKHFVLHETISWFFQTVDFDQIIIFMKSRLQGAGNYIYDKRQVFRIFLVIFLLPCNFRTN